jgi:hypothetical protein
MGATYHLELRRFPRSCTRFNQSGAQVGAILIPWVQDRVLELDGEKWAPGGASITVVEGPPIPVERLSMGRGWGIAQREGADVTERVLEEARQAVADGSAFAQGPAPPSGAAAPAAEAASLAESAPHEAADEQDTASGEAGIAHLLGPDAAGLLAAWRRVAARTAGLAPSESLALAERELQREDRPRP